jgi:DNA-binding MarR family transcriptional regulator
MSGGAVDRDQLVGRVAGALKVSETQAQARIAELADAHLVQLSDDERARVTLTDAGSQLHHRISDAATEVTQRLWGDLPAEDLATAGRVLSAVAARADAELAGA